MASLSDIPDPLLHPNGAEQFTDWLVTLPLELAPRRELAAIWRRFNRTSLSVDQWQRIERTSLPTTDA